jgi:hypothetical protein
MAAHGGRTIGDAEFQLLARTHIHRLGNRHVLVLERHALMHIETIGAGLVGDPLATEEAGIKMNVAFDEAGQDQQPGEIHDLLPAPLQRRRPW